MSAIFDRRAIMRAAHSFAKRRAFADKTPGAYRFWFKKGLEKAWKSAKADRARAESNIGLPIRSCRADAPAPRAVLVSRYGTVRIFAGPGAHAAAIRSLGDTVGSSFSRERAAGRRAADFA